MNAAEVWSDLKAADWEALAQAHGTALYLFDADEVARRVARVREAFEGQVGVYYAVKANPNLALLRAVRPAVDGLDISSGGELEQGQLAGFDAEAMSFAGPAKTGAEIDAAVAAGVGCISCESLREIDACAEAARRLGRPARILLRVNPEQVHKGYGLKMAGKAVQFGIDEPDLPQAEERVRSHGQWLDCRGIHAYVGSQCFDVAGVVEAVGRALKIAADSAARGGWPLRKLNLGGGFGIAQAGEAKALDLESAAAALRPVIAAFRSAHPEAQLFFELGRFITAPAGIYVIRVVDVKTSRGTRFATCDGGLNHHLNAAGTFGALLRANYPLLNLSRPDVPAEAHEAWNIAGPSCNPTDLLGVQARLAAPRIGDLLGIPMSGAYGLTASPLLFLGRETPVELVRAGGAVTVGRIRRRMVDFN